jgi:hypothetical protein
MWKSITSCYVTHGSELKKEIEMGGRRENKVSGWRGG